MPRVLTVDGSVKIGAYRFPDRKKPCPCVESGITWYDRLFCGARHQPDLPTNGVP